MIPWCLVVRVDRSPINSKRWCLTLDCGHEIWKTSAKRPTAQTADCPHKHTDSDLAWLKKRPKEMP